MIAAVRSKEPYGLAGSGQLALILAHPAELRPAMRQRADRRLDPPLASLQRYPHLEPVVLRLHPRGRLHTPERPEPRLPVLAFQVPYHRLVAALVAVVPNQDLIDLTDLGRATLTRQPAVLQSHLDRLDDIRVAI